MEIVYNLRKTHKRLNASLLSIMTSSINSPFHSVYYRRITTGKLLIMTPHKPDNKHRQIIIAQYSLTNVRKRSYLESKRQSTIFRRTWDDTHEWHNDTQHRKSESTIQCKGKYVWWKKKTRAIECNETCTPYGAFHAIARDGEQLKLNLNLNVFHVLLLEFQIWNVSKIRRSRMST